MTVVIGGGGGAGGGAGTRGQDAGSVECVAVEFARAIGCFRSGENKFHRQSGCSACGGVQKKAIMADSRRSRSDGEFNDDDEDDADVDESCHNRTRSQTASVSCEWEESAFSATLMPLPIPVLLDADRSICAKNTMHAAAVHSTGSNATTPWSSTSSFSPPLMIRPPASLDGGKPNEE